MNDVLFDVTKLTVVVIVNNTPVDCSAGLAVDGDLLNIKKENQDEVTTRRGTKEESYSANSIKDNSRLLKFKYIPSAPAVKIFQALRDTREMFGIAINYAGVPGYSLSSDKCVFTTEPETKISAKTGFADYEFDIRALNSVVVFT